MSEPLSVLIAKAKGCNPKKDEFDQFWCMCPPGKHTYPEFSNSIVGYENEAWLHPAAAFSLLAEMIKGGAMLRTEDGELIYLRTVDGGLVGRSGPFTEKTVARFWLLWDERPR